MKTEDYIKLAGYHDAAKSQRIARQSLQVVATGEVDCHCGRRCDYMESFRCLYCGEYYCFPCAQKHFGRTLRDWLGKKHPEALRRYDSSEMVKYCKPMGSK